MAKKTKHIVLLTIIFAALMVYIPLTGQFEDDYTLKAIWMGKFTHFINWPPKARLDSCSFYIGILKKDPFNGELENIYSNRTIWNKPVKIKYIESLDSLAKINLLFVPSDFSHELKAIVPEAEKHSVLLVGDTKGYAEQGVHINFFRAENRIRFEINETSIRESGFFVSYRLLHIAKIVNPIPNE